jgi:hypothetical protein
LTSPVKIELHQDDLVQQAALPSQIEAPVREAHRPHTEALGSSAQMRRVSC